MLKTIYIYVGPHRSGSQFLLRKITPNIKGLYDVRSKNVALNEIVMEAMDEHPDFLDPESYKERISGVLDAIDEDKILFANEEFFGDYGRRMSDGPYISQPFYDNQFRIDVLKKLFGNPKIIMTPRRQDLWVESAYMHFIHNFQTVEFDEFFNPGMDKGPNLFKFRSNNQSINFKALDWGVYLKNYHSAFGEENVLVIPNEMMRHDLQDAVNMLCDFTKVDRFDPGEIPQVNRSYSAPALRAAKLINRFILVPGNRFGFIPVHPFLKEIQTQRAKKESKLLWFLAGISRRISPHWFLNEIVGRLNYKKPDNLGPERREMVLSHYRRANKDYAEMIHIDLEKYGYY